MPLLTCPSILMHTSIYAYTVIIKAACIYPSYSSCQTSRKYIYTLCTRCDYCFIPMSYPLFSLFTFTFQYMYIPMFVHLSFSSFLFAILNNSRSLFPSLSCTWCFILLEIGLLSLSLSVSFACSIVVVVVCAYVRVVFKHTKACRIDDRGSGNDYYYYE